MFSLTAAAQAEMFEYSAVDGEWLETGDPLTYRFRDSAGKVTEFSLREGKDKYTTCLYINGEPAKRADTPIKTDVYSEDFCYLMDGRILPFTSIKSGSGYSDSVEVDDYHQSDDITLYDPISGELITKLSAYAGVEHTYGYLNSGYVSPLSFYNAKYNIEENGHIEPGLTGPKVTDIKIGENSVTLSYENITQLVGSFGRDLLEYKDYAVSYRKKGDTEFISAPAPKNNKASVTNLEKGAEYTIRITTIVKSEGFTYLFGHTDTDIIIPDKAITDGWNDVCGKKAYSLDGKLVSGQVMNIDGKLYCFDTTGVLASAGYITLNDKQYYVYDDGTVAVSTYLKSDHNKMEYTFANRNGEVYTYVLEHDDYLGDRIKRNGDSVSLEELLGRKIDDIIDLLDLAKYSKTEFRPFIIFDGRIFSFDGNYILELVSPSKAVNREGILYDAATGECLGVFRFSSKKQLDYDKKYLYSGTLSMVGSDIKYTIGSNGAITVSQLKAPESLTAETSTNIVKLSWKEVKGADSYNVYLYDKTAKDYKLYKNVKETNCTISDLKKSTTYKLRVAAVVNIPGSGLEQKPADISAKTAAKTLNGLIKKGSDKFYYRDGFKVKNEVVKVSGKYYGFDSSGKMIKNKTCTISGDTYQFGKTGAAVTDKWTYKGYTGATYIGKDGKFTTYDFSDFILQINGEDATPKDFKKYGSGRKTFLFGKLYYTLNIDDKYVNISFTDKGKSDIYDIVTGKIVDTIVTGMYFNPNAMDRTVLDEGSVYSIKTGTIYKFNNHKIKTKTKASSPLIICENSSGTNSVGGLDTTIDFYNNSSKSIKYIKVNVSAMNRVNDTVSCDIQRKSSFNLLYTGPLAANSYDRALWEAYMYNYSADHARINSITITYMDGTTKTLSAGQFIDISW